MSCKNTVESFTHCGLSVEIEYDTDCEDPRAWDNLGTMVCWSRKHSLGDEQPKYPAREFHERLAKKICPELEEIEERVDAICHRFWIDGEKQRLAFETAKRYLKRKIEQIIEENTLILPLYLYDHSGITMNTTGFSCPWDSGQVGFIYVSKDKIVEEYGDDSAESYEKARKYLVDKVETYDQYLRGEVYCYTIKSADSEDGDEPLDSCWGFYGLEHCIEAAKESAEYAAKKIANRIQSDAENGVGI